MNVSRLLFFGITLGSVALFGQRKEDLQSIQRDVAQLQEQVTNLQKSEDAKMAALQNMLQQAADGSNRVYHRLGSFAARYRREIGRPAN